MVSTAVCRRSRFRILCRFLSGHSAAQHLFDRLAEGSRLKRLLQETGRIQIGEAVGKRR
jgi:hypothetical protein